MTLGGPGSLVVKMIRTVVRVHSLREDAMKKKTETEEIWLFCHIFISLVAFRLGGGARAHWSRPPLAMPMSTNSKPKNSLTYNCPVTSDVTVIGGK